jgi:hypothetical protein
MLCLTDYVVMPALALCWRFVNSRPNPDILVSPRRDLSVRAAILLVHHSSRELHRMRKYINSPRSLAKFISASAALLATFWLAACGSSGEASSSNAAGASPVGKVAPIARIGPGTPAAGVSNGPQLQALYGIASVPIDSAPIANPVSVAAEAGTATLNWIAPDVNTDGSAINDLAGFNIYYGTSPTAMSNRISIMTADSQSYVLYGLAPGSWYFTVTAINNEGLESAEAGPVEVDL